MRVKFVEASSASQARKMATWAAKVVKVTGGYRCFESMADYKTWASQK